MLILEDLAAYRVHLGEVIRAGESLNPEVIERVRSVWGVTIRDGYGQNDTIRSSRVWTGGNRGGTLQYKVCRCTLKLSREAKMKIPAHSESRRGRHDRAPARRVRCDESEERGALGPRGDFLSLTNVSAAGCIPSHHQLMPSSA